MSTTLIESPAKCGGQERNVGTARWVLPVLIATALAGALATSAQADAPTSVGGLALTPYCQSLGYDGDILTKPQLGPNAAYDNWRCFIGTRDAPISLHPFSMEQACKFQYGPSAIQTHPTDPNDAYTWVCYSVAHD